VVPGSLRVGPPATRPRDEAPDADVFTARKVILAVSPDATIPLLARGRPCQPPSGARVPDGWACLQLASLDRHRLYEILGSYAREGHQDGGARIVLKREDLVHGGAHKGNNALGQALLAKRMGKKRLIAETGAGQHGTATAMVAALMGLDCTIYMGAHDVDRQRPNVERMELMGASVVPVTQGDAGLKDAVDVALSQWCTRLDDTSYILGSATGPHPFPTIVRHFQTVISAESRRQVVERFSRLPDAVIACVGGGSNAIGAFASYIDDAAVALVGVEPAGKGLDTPFHGAPICAGRTGILHGTRSYVMLSDSGEVLPSHSVSAGLDYPSVGPEHAHLADTGRATYVGITDEEAIEAFGLLSRYEGIIPAMESSHAVAQALKMAREHREGRAGGDEEPLLLVNLSGRGDKDMDEVRGLLG